ncbi:MULTISPECIES: glycosyltransferase family 4 protein [unclassified Dyella]|uniref:glycosyltransferase family 4 protein n=1 Tax=unclassified Dyella TaxID=2634549 RepID=UPI000C82583B|nr:MULTISPECIES: glycosyltransferase family 4 protein [unclassified Dyella]MDR3443919.1 glycosyltransferase family 4 protein [Dyella sp.]PMQ05192.1 D-inositol 3-phosphate glycosyltransferase [Dyella sp. AD56]
MKGYSGAILLDGELRDREAQKSQHKGISIQGFDVFLEGFSRALFSFSEHGPIVIPREALLESRGSMPEWFPDVKEKIRATAASDIQALCAWERLLMLSMGPEMLQYAWMRAEAGRPDWPITAILHSPQPIPRIRYLFTNRLMSTLGQQDALVCPSNAARSVIEATFEAVPISLRATDKLPMQLPVIPMGVDIDGMAKLSREEARRALDLPENGPILLWFGRLSPADKGEMLPFLRTIAPVVERYQARFVMAGDDTSHRMADTLRDLATELGYGDRFTVLPDVTMTEKRLLLRAANIFLALNDSMHAGFSLTIAEAMASGLPIIASDWAGHREWIREGYTGRLVPTYLSDDPSHRVITLYAGAPQEKLWELSTIVDLRVLKEALESMLSAPDDAARMGEAALRFARQTFDWSVIMGKYDELWYEQFARASRSSARKDPFPTASFPKFFAEYPTRFIRPTDVVTMGSDAFGDELVRALADTRYFRVDVFRYILQQCRERPTGGTVGAIVKSVCHATEGLLQPAQVERHIARLLKHGLLEMDSHATAPLAPSDITTSVD